jgi:hypothetical protein
MDIAEHLKEHPPDQPGTAQVCTGRVTKFVALCTTCGVSEEQFPNKARAMAAAIKHVEDEHGVRSTQ